MSHRDSGSRSSRSGRSSNQPYPPLAPGQASSSSPSAPYGFNQQAGYAQAPQQGVFPPHPSAYPNQQHTQAHHPAHWGQPPLQGQQYPPAGYGNPPTFTPVTAGQPHVQSYGNVGQDYSQGFPPPAGYYHGQQAQSPNLEGHLDSADRSLGDRELNTFDEVSRARELIQAAKISYRSLAQYRKDYPHLNILAISFSKIEKVDLEAIGVHFTDKKTNNFQSVIIPKILTTLEEKNYPARVRFKSVFDDFWNSVESSQFGLVRMVQSILVTVGRKPEARGRILIDQFLLFMTNLCQRLGAIPFIFPELHLASSTTSSSNPCALLIGNKKAIMMSGSVDYAMIYTNLSDKTLADAMRVSEERAKGIRNSFLSTGSLSGLIGHREMSDVMMNVEATQIFLIEAKKKELDLEDRVPQVVAECFARQVRSTSLALPSISDRSFPIPYVQLNSLTVPMGRTRLPWCLTNGMDWIFGAVELRTIKGGIGMGGQPTPATVERKSYRFPVLSLQSANGTLAVGAIKMVFTMLMFWSVATPQEISGLISSIH